MTELIEDYRVDDISTIEKESGTSNPWVMRNLTTSNHSECPIQSSASICCKCQNNREIANDQLDKVTENTDLNNMLNHQEDQGNNINKTKPSRTSLTMTSSHAEFGPICSKRKHVIGHLIQFCESTSLRGVPKIVKTERPKLRWLWVVFVAGLFLGCIICLGMIILQYIEKDVMLQKKVVSQENQPFPTVTFCNQFPFSNKAIERIYNANLPTMYSYLSYVDKQLKTLKNQSIDITSTDDLNAYLMNLPKDFKNRQMGHSKHSLILQCNVTFADSASSKSCYLAGRWTRTQNKEFLNCFSLTMDDDVIRDVDSLNLWLNIDSFEGTDCFGCNVNLTSREASGIRLQLHTPNTYPNVKSKGVNVIPGTLTEIRYQSHDWNMLEPPHGNCSNHHVPHLSLSNATFQYSRDGCILAHFQEHNAQMCGCVDFGSTIPTELISLAEQGRYCKLIDIAVVSANDELANSSQKTPTSKTSRLTDIAKAYLEQLACLETVETRSADKRLDESSDRQCPIPCRYSTYKLTSISAAQWPAKTFQLAVYKSLRDSLFYGELELARLNQKKVRMSTQQRERTLRHLNSLLPARRELLSKMNKYSEIINLTAQGYQEEAKKKLKGLDFIDTNFLAVQITKSDLGTILIQQKPVISLTRMLSQVGGMLSVWVGLSFVIIVEVFELIMNLFGKTTKQRKSR